MIKKCFVVAVVALCSACSRSETGRAVRYSNGRYYGGDQYLITEAERHAQLLRAHFLGKDVGLDLSTLIAQTRALSARLKRVGKLKTANQFDSYTDMLMYGNNTIDESINDVMKLVNFGYLSPE